LAAKLRPELDEQRTVKLGKLLPPAKQARSAEFMVLLSPGGVTGVKFLSGEETLRATSDALRTAKYPVEFPDSTDTKLARRGVLSCELAGSCKYVLYQPEEVISAE
jgi:hypothetical protein